MQSRPIVSSTLSSADRQFLVIAFDAESNELLREQVQGEHVRGRLDAFGQFAGWCAVIRVKSERLSLAPI